MFNWSFTARSSDCCSYRTQPVSPPLTAQGCLYRFVPGCSPRTTCDGCAGPAGHCYDRAALPLTLTLVADQASPSLTKSLQAQGWRVLDQGMVGVRPLPRQQRGDGMHSPGRGTCWGLMLHGEPGLWMEMGAREKGNVWFAHGSR